MTSQASQPEFLLVATRNDDVRARMERAESALTALPGAVIHPSPVPGRLHLTTAWARSDAFFCGLGVFGSTLYRDAEMPPQDETGRGCFILVRGDEGGAVRITSDPLAMFPVFVFHKGGTVAVSTSAMLLEHAMTLLGLPLRRSNALSGFIVTLGSGYDGMTAFDDVRMLAAGEILTLDRDNRAAYQTTHVGNFLYSAASFDSLLDEAVHEIQSNVRAISKVPVERRICDVTGGMDSRLVVAAILHEGLQDTFQFQTNGAYPNPDANAAALIRQTFGLAKATPYRAPPDKALKLEPIDRMRLTIGKMSGILDMYMATGLQDLDLSMMSLGGGLGEIMRKFWSSEWSRAKPERTPLHKVVQSMEARAALLRPDVFRQQAEAVSEKGFQYLRESIQPNHVGDAFYLTARCQYHFGVWWSRSRVRFHPLYSVAALRAAHAISEEERRANRVGFEMMRRMSPAIVEMPFANKRWNLRLHASPPEPITVESPPYGDQKPPKPPKAETFAQTMASKGAHRKVVQLPRIMENFAQAYPDADYSVLGDVFDAGAVSRFMTDALQGFEDTKDTWMAYRIMMAYIWATRGEIWSTGGPVDARPASV